ncbi:NUDIX hydrolase [Demetria terragena]|uniref:NUDIX hydrolase n=1 Tax=Demetria terragena TaxID=63959 RepID=UPI0003775B08|nr:hypothetical protein [Demetria terragena]
MTLTGETELVAVVITVDDGVPAVLASSTPRQLPAGPLAPTERSLQTGVRSFVAEQTGHSLGFIQQLYTFADLGRGDGEDRVVSISYLGLTRAATDPAGWLAAYEALPWEDRRPGVPAWSELSERLDPWIGRGPGSTERRERRDHLFGLGVHRWQPDLALQRYELLWEAGLVAESPQHQPISPELGTSMLHDHRRIVATGLSRLRAMLQYRPVVFELMPESFTLGQLQDVAEALAGQEVHKQNFRRLVEHQHQLVEPTGESTHATGGRPARLYRYRREIFAERQQVGTKLPIPRAR